MRILEYCIEDNADHQTVERWLRQKGLSRRLIVLLKNMPDGLLSNGVPVRTIDRLQQGDRLRLCLHETMCTTTVMPVELPLHILYEDDDFFVLNKPAGMAVHPSQGNRDNTIANALAALYQKRSEPFVFRPIGRLDKNTSGLLVLAKNAL